VDKPVNAFVVSGLVKRRAELAGEIERTHEALTATIKRRIWIAPPEQSRDARYANKAPRCDPLLQFGYTKKALLTLAARRVWQITCKATESRSALAVERVFQQPVRASRDQVVQPWPPLRSDYPH
jgi:hypothetical protein